METGFYRCAQSHVSMEDWISLNFRRFDTDLLQLIIKHEPDLMYELHRLDLGDEPEEPDGDDLDIPEEPDEDDYPDTASYDAAYEEWESVRDGILSAAQEEYEEACEEWESGQQLYGWPFAQRTGYGARRNDDLVVGLVNAGFTVYQTEGDMDAFGEIVFGVDGGGYSFTEAHWIPLRMHLARSVHRDGYCSDEDYTKLVEVMADLYACEGGVRDHFLSTWGIQEAA